jgi:pyoverdine/dityrosine biosynthesis protein Dit1
VHRMNAYGFQLDITGVTDNHLWEYGATLRQMVNEKGYDKCIDFIRVMNLLGIYNHSAITQEKFISLLDPSRKELMERYGDPNFDFNACIKNDPDYKMTYDGYAKFLKKDLAHGAIRDRIASGKKYKAMVHESAKAMISRGVVSFCRPSNLALYWTETPC